MTHSGNFTKINEGFTCIHCHATVPPSSVTCRNHCNKCLRSLHIDEKPGDRASDCHGILDPYGYETSGKKGLVLLFKCRKCGFLGKNIALIDGEEHPDDYDSILALTGTPSPR